MKLMLLLWTAGLVWGQGGLQARLEADAKRWDVPAISIETSDGVELHSGKGARGAQYRAGSITKVVTAVALMQLVEAGKVDLDAPLGKYLPEVKLPVTLRQMVSHRSGMVREPGRGHYFDTKPATAKQVTASMKDVPLVYAPGTRTKYSNAAVTMLGDVIARVSGEPYAVYVRKHVLEPLGMKDSVFVVGQASRMVEGQMWTIDGRTFPAPKFDLGLEAAGNLITTSADLLRFGKWLAGKDTQPVLRRETLELMWKAQAGGTRFGIGFALDQWEGKRVIGHGGAVYGHSALLVVMPERQWAGVGFAAKDSADFVLRPLLKAAAGVAAPEGKAPQVNVLQHYAKEPGRFASPYLGEYGWDFNKFYVLEHKGKLHALVEWFSLGELKPLKPGEYIFGDDAMYGGETVKIDAKGLWVGPVWFPKLPEPDRNFRVKMQKPLAELKRIAAASTPPVQPAGLREPELVNLKTLGANVKLDIRYASTNNFMGTPLYSLAEAYLQKPAAEALARAGKKLEAQGYGLLIHDAYRPWKVTKMFWEATPTHQRNFVANPATGSRHNRGCAIDMSIYDLKTGKPVVMPSGYDEFSDRAYPDYPGGTSHERWLRDVLRSAMESEGFVVNDDEWWHYDYKDWKQYPVLDISFERLGSR